MTLQELRALRDTAQKAMDRRVGGDKSIELIVGMGTCGIAAGARDTLNAFVDELNSKDIRNVLIKQVGCMGFCHVEPTVEVKVVGMPDVLYGNVDAEAARTIVQRHILEKKLVDKYVFDKPSKDTFKDTGKEK
jgi:NADP-reducing hydrogenase subunit HndB